jgi:hypothetical protein
MADEGEDGSDIAVLGPRAISESFGTDTPKCFKRDDHTGAQSGFHARPGWIGLVFDLN